jgi:FixJ family two-component response regulator
MDLNLNGKWADDLVVELARKNIPVVVVTGYDIKQSVAEHAFATLKKPVTYAVLLDTLYRAANSADHRAIATAAPIDADTRLPRSR